MKGTEALAVDLVALLTAPDPASPLELMLGFLIQKVPTYAMLSIIFEII